MLTSKNKWITGLLIGNIVSGINAFGQGAEGHGGYVTDVNGTPRLYELVTTYTCDPIRSETLIQNVPELDSLLNTLSNLDWYFGIDLKREINQLRFCFTEAELPYFPAVDPVSPLAFDANEYFRTAPVGLRYGNQVYVSKPRFESLVHSRDKAKFIIHEAVHTYFPDGIPNRKLRFYTFLKNLSEVLEGTISYVDFKYKSEMNQVAFPIGEARLNPYREQVEYLTASHEQRKQKILSSSQPESLAAINVSILNPILANRHQQNVPAIQTLEEDIIAIIRTGTAAEMQTLLKLSYEKIQVPLLALSQMEILSSEKRALLLSSAQTEKLLGRIYDSLDTLRLTQGKFLLLAGPDVQRLGSNSLITEEPIEFLKIQARLNAPPKCDSSNIIAGLFLGYVPMICEREPNLPPTIQGITQIIRILYRSGETERLKALVTENQRFYDSLGLKSLFRQIQSASFHFVLEKKVASDHLAFIRDGMIDRFFIDVLEGFDPNDQKEIKKLIHSERFK